MSNYDIYMDNNIINTFLFCNNKKKYCWIIELCIIIIYKHTANINVNNNIKENTVIKYSIL